MDLFFVISGFVITKMLIDREDAGRRATLAWFWGRRLRRLLPAVVVTIVGVLVWTSKLGAHGLFQQTRGEGLAGLVYVNNWYDIFANVGYWSVGLDRTPLNHLWSLSIEEQFYLAWPLLFILVARRGARLWRLAVVAGLAVVGSAVLQPILFTRDGYNRAYLGTDTRVAAILIGALIAIAFTRKLRSGWSLSAGAPRIVLGLAGCSAVVGLAYLWATSTVTGSALYHGGLIGASLLAGLVAFAVVADSAGLLARLFRAVPLVALGRVSYSLYLWHVPVIVLVNRNTTGLTAVGVTVLRISLIAALTVASYFLVERPIHVGALSLGNVATAFAAGAALCLSALYGPALLSGLGHSALNGSASVGTFTRSFSPAEVRAQSVMVVGDSWSVRTGIEMATMPSPSPKRVIQLGEGNCGITDPVTSISNASGQHFKPDATCRDHLQRWKAGLASGSPTIVIMQVGNIDQAAQQLVDGGPYLTPCDPGLKARFNQKLDDGISLLSSRGAKVFVTTVIDGSGTYRAGSDCVNAMLRAAVIRNSRKGAYLLDLNQRICPDHRCLSTIGGVPLLDDTGHIAAPALPAINRWIWARIGDVMGTETPARDLWTGSTQTTPVLTTNPAPQLVQASLPSVKELAGGEAQPIPVAPSTMFAGVEQLTSDPGYRTLVAQLAAATSSVAYRTATGLAAGAFNTTETLADADAGYVKSVMISHHAVYTELHHYQMEFFAVSPKVTVAFLRTTNAVDFVVATDAAHANEGLQTIAKTLGRVLYN